MSRVDDMLFDGGRLCLDFVNTVHDRYEEPQRDYLKNIGDLIHWSKRTGILDNTYYRSLTKNVESNLSEVGTKKFFESAIDLRELLYAIFLDISHSRKVGDEILSEFNALIPGTLSKLEIGQKRSVFISRWIKIADLSRITWPIIKDAYDLLLLNKSERIKECPKCGWLFFDSSKNGKRKWCSMETCGSRAKAIEWYRRQKS